MAEIVLAAASEHLPFGWSAYEPAYRTPAGTGCGLAFLERSSEKEDLMRRYMVDKDSTATEQIFA